MFADPFIHHAVRSWLDPTPDPYATQVCPAVDDPESASRLVEATVVSHMARRYPTCYIKAEGEVDVAIVDGGCFRAIEVKWRGQVRSKDLKQLRKYAGATLLAPVRAPHDLDGVRVEPLVLALLGIEE